MVKMIILLMLCLPLVLMLCLFTTTSVVSIAVDIPVGGIEIVSDDIIELDLDRGESFTVDYVISPTEASNTDVTVTFEEIPGEKLATFSVNGGTITPTSYGSAKVIVETVDGGYRDSFTVIVYSNRVESIVSTPVSNVITVGESTEITTVYYPSSPNDEGLSYRVKEGEGIVTVTSSGKIHGIGLGTAVVEVASLDNPEATYDVTVEVVSSGVIDFANDTLYLTSLDICNDNVREIPAVLNPDMTVGGYSIRLLDGRGAELSADVAVAELDIITGIVTVTVNDTAYVGIVEAEITVTTTDGESVTKSCYVNCIREISISLSDSANNYVTQMGGDNAVIGIDQRPLGADVSYGIVISYSASTSVSGNVHSGDSIMLAEGETYVCNGGYVSIQLVRTANELALVVKGVESPSWDQLGSDATKTEITLTAYDNVSGSVIELGKLVVMAY